MSAPLAPGLLPEGALPPTPRSRRPLTDGELVVAVAALALGAWAHRPLPLVLVGAVVVAAAAWRHPVPVALAALVVGSAWSARAWAGLVPPPPGPVQATVTLVSDPVPARFGTRADVRLQGHRYEVRAFDGAAGALSASAAGERVAIEGRVRPLPRGQSWAISRHLVGAVDASHLERSAPAPQPWRAANRVRSLVAAGAEALPADIRPLYLGLVLGDDRGQAPEVVDDFRGAGLTHLLVVSGQNVAFVLVVAAPVLRRFGWRARWAATVGLVAAFAVVTRFEPSVVRASAMSAVAVTAAAAGRPGSALRTVALGVGTALLVDPLLVWSTGFQLSVGACVAIVLLAGPIADLIPGPRVLADALGVTLAAQVGVAPVLIPLTGGLPVASLVANPLAVPVAGLVTTWGLPAGLAAGVLGHPAAVVLQAPTAALVGWVAGVARLAAAVPLGTIGWPHLGALLAAALLARLLPARRSWAALLAVVALVAPAIALRHHPPVGRLGTVQVVRRSGATGVAVDPRAPADAVLRDLRRAGVGGIDVLVLQGSAGTELAEVVGRRHAVRRVVRSDPLEAAAVVPAARSP